MTQQEYTEMLTGYLTQLADASRWLERSLALCGDAFGKPTLDPGDYDAFEALTSRFARVADILLQKVFRCLDAIEMEEGGTLLDALNRAEKRGLISSVEWFRLVREVRNEIAHEYSVADLLALFQSVQHYAPELLDAVRSTRRYCGKYVPGEKNV